MRGGGIGHSEPVRVVERHVARQAAYTLGARDDLLSHRTKAGERQHAVADSQGHHAFAKGIERAGRLTAGQEGEGSFS